MFPFEKRASLLFNLPNLEHLDKQELINRFVEQFDEAEQNSTGFSFRNFKSFYKRHKWLNGGHLSFDFQDNQVKIDLQLNFYYVPVLFVFLSITLAIIHWERIQLAGFFIGILWLLYSLMYTWTSITFKSTIRRGMRRYSDLNIRHEQFLK